MELLHCGLEPFPQQCLQLVTGEHAGDADLVQQRSGLQPRFPGQIGHQERVKSIGAVDDQQRPPRPYCPQSRQQPHSQAGIVAREDCRACEDLG